ncbi:MAG: DUF4258 domain-containing protein [Deltaproteobacteria bacterium]|nr:DUF4258 domain-containing protein [Deltaproteobacteria bacterium]MBW2010895.1 DUF4258 domain-containing protein [Deltaproteobacteria bacterium]MBW2099330.1 DUF4258 domain-containing protein [Deltaproteobacteria bacterium]
MDKNQAKEIIREVTKHGCFMLSKHCRLRMSERNVTMEDIIHVLKWGEVLTIQETPYENNFKCKIKGKDFDDEDLTIHASIIEKKRTVIITVY